MLAAIVANGQTHRSIIAVRRCLLDKLTATFASPLARALIGKKKGAEVEVAAPGGAKDYKVLTVEWT
jgi:transcription elongation GreA/GreB family factor